MEKPTQSYGKLFLYLLTLSFIVLKLCKVIGWSWWYVTMPLWAGAALFLFVWGLIVLLKLFIPKTKKPYPPFIEFGTGKKQPSKFQQRLDEYMEQQRKANKP